MSKCPIVLESRSWRTADGFRVTHLTEKARSTAKKTKFQPGSWTSVGRKDCPNGSTAQAVEHLKNVERPNRLIGIQSMKSKNASRYVKISLLVAIIFLLISCKKQDVISPYKLIDSGMWISDSSEGKVWWLNNEQVLFPTNENMQPKGGSSTNVIWNLSTGQFTSIHLQDVLCVQNGLVFYEVLDRAAGKYNFYRGTLENPIEYPRPSPNMRVDAYYNCDWAPEFSRKNTPYRVKLKDDNYLEILKGETLTKDKKVQHGEVRYFERLDLPPKPLPVYVDINKSNGIVSEKGNLFESYSIDFNPLQNAYFISPSAFSPDDAYYHSLWWLQRDGKMTSISFPKHSSWLSRGRLYVYPLKDGYLALYKCRGKSFADSGASGLYLVKGENIEKVLLGEISGVSISPDGCRAAFSHARNTAELLSQKKPYQTIKTINFCGKGK